MKNWRKLAILAAASLLTVVALVSWFRRPAPATVPPPPAETLAKVPERSAALSCPPTPVCAPAPAPPPAPTADPVAREAKRFGRNDKNDDGIVNASEYLASRRKSFQKMDANGDGLINFSEYSLKQRSRFAASDCDRTGYPEPGRVRLYSDAKGRTQTRLLRGREISFSFLRSVPRPRRARQGSRCRPNCRYRPRRSF